MKGALILAGAAALALVVVAEDGWIEVVAVVELLGIAAVFWLTGRWADRHVATLEGVTDQAMEAMEQYRVYGQKVTDVNAEAVMLLSEYSREEAAEIAGKFLDAYAVYREHAPGRDEG